MNERGSAVVEFALVVPLIIVVLLAVAEIAGIARVQLDVVNSAREGARTAAVNPEPAVAVAAVRRVLGEEGASASVKVRRPHVVGSTAVVTVTIRRRILAALFGGTEIELRSTAVMRVEG